MISKTVGGSANSGIGTGREAVNDVVACNFCLPATFPLQLRCSEPAECQPALSSARQSACWSGAASNSARAAAPADTTAVCVSRPQAAMEPPRMQCTPPRSVSRTTKPTQHARQHHPLCDPQCTPAATICQQAFHPHTLPFAHTCSFAPYAPQCTTASPWLAVELGTSHTVPAPPTNAHL